MARAAESARAAGAAPLRAWERFWFTPRASSTLFAFRVGLGFLVLCWALALGPDLMTFYSESGVLPDPRYASWRIGLFRWLESDAAIVGLYVALLASALAVAAGVAVRAAAPVMFLGVISFQLDNTLLLNAGDILIRILCAYLALYALLTPSRLTGPSLVAFAREGASAFSPAPVWLLRLAQIQLTLIYPFSVIDKFRGESWLDGTAVLRALQLVEFRRFWLPHFAETSLLIGNLLTYLTLALELSLPFLLWNARTRRAAIVVGMGMHLAFDYPLRVGFFSWAVLLTYLSFVTPEEMAHGLGAARSRLAGPRGVAKGQVASQARIQTDQGP